MLKWLKQPLFGKNAFQKLLTYTDFVLFTDSMSNISKTHVRVECIYKVSPTEFAEGINFSKAPQFSLHYI